MAQEDFSLWSPSPKGWNKPDWDAVGLRKYCELYMTGYQLIIYYSRDIGKFLIENLPQQKTCSPMP